MRFATILLAAVAAAPCIAQERVFRASSIDIEQDARLDSLESRVSQLESKPLSSPPPPVSTSRWEAKEISAPANVAAKPAARKPYATITIESLPGCPPCERWKAKEAKELRAQGWTVVEAPLTSSLSAPFFRVCIGDKCYSHSGFMSHSTLRSIIGKTMPRSVSLSKQSAVSSRYTTAELRAIINAKRPGGWRGPVYADVAPGYAKQHLVEPKHGFSWDQVSGLTTEEALILHDLAPTHGNQIFPTRRGY